MLTASDEIGTEECVEKEGSPSEQLGLNDSLDKKETTTDEADVEDMGEYKCVFVWDRRDKST